TVSITRDDEKIELIKERVAACQAYYETLLNQYR
ncbi:MAG: translocation protein TolB precursor, partial [Neisseria sp.]